MSNKLWIAWDKPGRPEGVREDAVVDVITATGIQHDNWRAGPEFAVHRSLPYIAYYRISEDQFLHRYFNVGRHSLPLKPELIDASSHYMPVDDHWLDMLLQAMDERA
jgi:hypothetical protein